MASEGFELTPQQRKHLEIIEAIARAMRDTPLVLKGGSAIVLGYHQRRFTEDLDFDSPRKLNLEHRILAALEKAGAKLLPIEAPEILKPKDTDTVQRYKLTYETAEGWRGRLKIETSFRQVPSAEAVCVLGGIRMYGLESLIGHKLACLQHRVRARDLVDIGFLAKNYPDHFQKQQAEELAGLLADSQALEARYAEAFRLNDVPMGDAQSAILIALEGLEAVRHQRATGQ